jgi:glycine betaine/proline transport system substrate-binding protein
VSRAVAAMWDTGIGQQGGETVERRTFLQMMSAAAVGGVFAAACGSDKKDSSPATTAASGSTAAGSTTAGTATTAAGGGGGGSGKKITLVQNSWTASAINVAIAKKVIEDNFGNEVELKAIDENTMFSGLAAGDLDACLELWPSGISADEKKYMDDKSVVELGKLGAIGRIGWYVPDYVQTSMPTTKTWEGFKDATLAKKFASAETGDLGRFLGTDPSYSQADEAIIKNLALPFKVIYSGSEAATVAALDSAVAAKQPILMYWWVPTAAAAKYKLVEVELPTYTDACYADPAKIACAYPEDTLLKVASAKLQAKDAKVYAFLTKFSMTNDDQLALLPSVEIDGKPAADVAAQWVKDNEAKWKAWL